MRPLNFVHLSTSIGFFFGLALSIAKFSEPEFVLFFVLICTLGSYLITLLMASLFIYNTDLNPNTLDKKLWQKNLEVFEKKFQKQEEEVKKLKLYLETLDKNSKTQISKNS